MATTTPAGVLAGDRAWMQKGVLPFLQNDLESAFSGFLASLLLPASAFASEKAITRQNMSRRWLFIASNVENILDLGLDSDLEKLRRHLKSEALEAAEEAGLPDYLKTCRNFPTVGVSQIVAEFLGEALRLDPDELLVYQELFLLFEEHKLDIASLAEAAATRGLLLHPLQRPTVLFELESRPFWELSQLKNDAFWILELEAQWKMIRGELDRALSMSRQAFASVGGEHRTGGRHDGEVLKKGAWSEVVLYGLDPEESRLAEQLFPRTRALLSSLLPTATSMAEEGFGEIIVSRLAPNSHIAPHCAPNNARLTAHLGLVIPKGCRIRVGSEWRGWEEGKVLLFDDSYEHEVVSGAEERVVLLIRFWHPECCGREESYRERDDRAFNWANFRKTMPPLGDAEVEQAMFGYDLSDADNCCRKCKKPMSDACFPAFFLDQATLKLRADFQCTPAKPK